MLKVKSAVIIMMKAHCTPECGMGRNPEGEDSVVLGEPNPPHSGVFLYVRLFVCFGKGGVQKHDKNRNDKK